MLNICIETCNLPSTFLLNPFNLHNNILKKKKKTTKNCGATVTCFMHKENEPPSAYVISPNPTEQ